MPRRRAAAPVPARAARRPPRLSAESISPAAGSCAVRHALAEQARRPEYEHQYQHEKCEHVLVVAAEQAQLAVARGAFLLQRVAKPRKSADVRYVADIARAERFDDAEQDASEHRAGEVADAAEHRRCKSLEAEQEAHVVVGDP